MIAKNAIKTLMQKFALYTFTTFILVIIGTTSSFVLFGIASQLIDNQNLLANQQEDFAFNVGYLSDEDAFFQNLRKEYGVNSEAQYSKLFTSDAKNVLIVRYPQEINSVYLVDGSLAENQSEVVIDRTSADAQDIKIGDKYAFNSEEYEVVGIVAYPNYVTPQMSESGILFNADSDSVISFSDATYNEIDFEESVYYAARFTEKSSMSMYEFIENNEEIIYAVEAQNNPQFNQLSLKASMFLLIAGFASVTMFSIVLILILMVIFKMVRDNTNMFGVLMANGYTRRQIILPFIMYPLLYIPAFAIGIIAGYLLQAPVFTVINADMILPISGSNSTMNLLASMIALAVIVMLQIFVFFVCIKAIGNDPILLLSKTSVQKLGNVKKYLFRIFSTKKPRSLMATRFSLCNFFVIFLLMFSGFAVMIQLLLGIGLNTFSEKMESGIKNTYAYQYSANFIQEIPNSEASNENAQYFTSIYVNYNSALIPLIVLQSSDYLSLKFTEDSSESMLLNDGVVINQWFASKYNLVVGEHMIVTYDGEEYLFKVNKISDLLTGEELYTSTKYFLSVTGVDLPANGAYSESEMIDDKNVANTMSKDAILFNVENQMSSYKVLSIGLMVIGIVIGVLIITLALNVAVNQQKTNILLLKSFGYKSFDIYFMTVAGQLVPIILGLLIAIPYFFVFETMFRLFSNSSQVFYDISVPLPVKILVAVIILLVFLFISTLFYRVINSDEDYKRLFED